MHTNHLILLPLAAIVLTAAGCVSESQLRDEIAKSRAEIEAKHGADLEQIRAAQNQLAADQKVLDRQIAGIKIELGRIETGFQQATERLTQHLEASRSLLRSHLLRQRDALQEQLKSIGNLVDAMEGKPSAQPPATTAPTR